MSKADLENKNEKSPAPIWNWLFWWVIDDKELDKQVNKYDELKITSSARGISFLLTFLSLSLSMVFVFLRGFDIAILPDALLMVVLGFLTFKGYRWSSVVMMIFWTYVKAWSWFNIDRSSVYVIFNIIWWAVYMHAFYLALRVENARKNNDECNR